MKSNDSQSEISIVGAGLSGSYLALLLGKMGYTVHCYEKRSDPRIKSIYQGRSINLAISRRGLDALKFVGLEHRAHKIAIPMLGRYIHNLNKEISIQPYSLRKDVNILSISRQELNIAILDACKDLKNIHFHFDSGLIEVNLDEKTASFSSLNGRISKKKYEKLIGTDGSASAVRSARLKKSHFDYQQTYLSYGYKELKLEPCPKGEYQLSGSYLHIWPRGNFMLIALPNPDKTFTCTLFLPLKGEERCFEKLKTAKAIEGFFSQNFKDVLELIPDLHLQFSNNPTGNLMWLKCSPWHFEDSCLLIGDAAHAIVPFYGQGMNCAFESCRIFVNLLEKNNHCWKTTLQNFTEIRKPDTDAICDLALNNFEEMQSKVADENFLLRKRISHNLEKMSDNFKTQYSMVTFSNTSYSKAKKIGPLQDKLIGEIINSSNSYDDINWKKAKVMLDQYFDESKNILNS